MTTPQFSLLVAVAIFFTGLTLAAVDTLGTRYVMLFITLGFPLASMFWIIWSNLRPEPASELPTITLADICKAAMQRVNINLWESDFRLTDIGLLVSQDGEDQNPELIRNQPIPKNAHYLRPFAAV